MLSASSVSAYRETGDSYTVVRRQLMWVIIAVPCAYVASRVSVKWVRGLSYPAFSVSLVLLALTAMIGVRINGNTNWLAIGPLQIQPSEIAKLSLVIWASHIYANKERRLRSLHEMIVPVVPGMLLATTLVVVGRDGWGADALAAGWGEWQLIQPPVARRAAKGRQPVQPSTIHRPTAGAVDQLPRRSFIPS